MEHQFITVEQKLAGILHYAPVGIAEINESGTIAFLNLSGGTLLKPIFTACNFKDNNLFPVLQLIAPSVKEKIENFQEETGVILMNEMIDCFIPLPKGAIEKYVNFIVNKVSPGCIIVTFDDITEKYVKEKNMQQMQLKGAVEQGKLEIASGVLHDIGNAVVGFGSYLTRIKRVLERNNLDSLQNFSRFFTDQQKNFADFVGEAKAEAAVNLLNGITLNQKASREEIGKSIKEQLNIITHIQEIINIQRQYVSGQETAERTSVNLRNIISDCMAMLFASFDKRGIAVSVHIPADLPILKGDRTQLMQMALNILKNSLEAIEVTAPVKKVSIRLYTQPHLLVLQVQDSGMGFDEFTASQLFKRGYTTKNSGTGLGLYNCRAIIESHGGTIDLTSEGPGKGAVTKISFPVESVMNE